MMRYFEEKIGLITFYFLFIFMQFFFGYMIGLKIMTIIPMFILSLLLLFGYLLFDYCKINKRNQEITFLVDNLEEKYLISEVIKKPKRLENIAYYYALKKATKAMNDKITLLESKYKGYQEYIESFVHEIKTPLAALSLYCDNQKLVELKQEVNKMDNLVEQVLFYARSENPQKDYFIKEINLSDVIHQIIMQNKDYFLMHKIAIETDNLDINVASDEKWLIFIINQIINNSIKYMDKKQKKIIIQAKKEKTQIILEIIDNGIGIKESDLSRVFEAGFTGSDRLKTRATGMGLYLANKICLKLGLKLLIASKYHQGTKVTIIFPNSDFNKMND